MKDSKHSVHKLAQDVFLIWKTHGETPLQALERLREQEGFGNDVKMTYAGRLDPLAEGQLLILTGDECKKKDEYLGLDKEYEVEILLGASTDTGDVMGIINEQAKTAKSGFAVEEIKEVLNKFVGKISWPYPAFSSKAVQGKSLFLWALEGKIDEVEIPMRDSKIYELELLSNSITKFGRSELRDIVHCKINSLPKVRESEVSKKLGANFRRIEVLESWANFFEKCPKAPFGQMEVIKIRCKCSSGTYMRTLAQKIGTKLGTSALAFSIMRTKLF